MNNECDAHTLRIMEAIGYGQLPPRQTQERLEALLDAETGRTDCPADMQLISAAHDLLSGLNGLPEEPREERTARLNALKARIAATAKEDAARRDRRRRRFQRAAALAAAAVMLLSVFGQLQWNWVGNHATLDAQQQVFRGHEITVGKVAYALAAHQEAEAYKVKDVSEFDAILGFELGMPAVIHGDLQMTHGELQFFRKKFCVSALYQSSGPDARSIICCVEFYADPEAVYYTVEQSAEGEYVEHDGSRVYISMNSDKINAVWSEDLTLIHIAGDANQQEVLEMMAEVKGALMQ